MPIINYLIEQQYLRTRSKRPKTVIDLTIDYQNCNECKGVLNDFTYRNQESGRVNFLLA